MAILVTIIHIIVCFMLIAVILLQAGKGQGLTGASFGGGNVQSLLGTKGADFMTKATTVAAIGFMLTCLTLSFIETRRSRSLLETNAASAPLDVDQIKKALEKVKAEAAATENTATEALKDAAAVVQAEAAEAEKAAMSIAEDAVANVKAEAAELEQQAEANTDQAVQL